jgi:TonB family protein
MKWYFQLALLSMLPGVFFALTQSAFAQTATQSETPQTGVVMTKLSPPVYPPLARQARIMGEVKIDLRIRQDGSVESAALFSGHPMLAPAAIESAKKSTFECRNCDAAATPYSVTYAFVLQVHADYCDAYSRGTELTESLGRVVVSAEPTCICDPASSTVSAKTRSAKCFYLWKCGFRRVDLQ